MPWFAGAFLLAGLSLLAIVAAFQQAAAGPTKEVEITSAGPKSPVPNDARPLPPDVEPKFMTVPKGFHVNLFAGEPDIVQPSSITFDDRGRLWATEFISYPKWKPEGNDRVLIFSEKPGAGQFDQRKVFWDKGNYLSGVELGFGGAWVCCVPKIMFIPMKEGSDAPQGDPQTVLDGWSTSGGHNMVNALTWGPDGWLYGCNGISAPSKVGVPGTPDDQRVAISCGVWRYHPTKHIFEAVAHGQTNPWGLDFDDYGQMFTTNCVIAHLWHIIPGAHYKRMRGDDYDPYVYDLIDATCDHLHWGGGDWTSSRGGKGIHSEAGGGHAHAGAMVYLGDNWPDSYRNTIFMCNIHGNRVNNDILERRGAGYVGKHGRDFLLSADPWFRGLNLKYGPDGAVYLNDWCDNGECHNVAQTDKTSGRIYKIAYGTPLPPPADLDLNKLTDLELVQLQSRKNDWYVRHARRILQERAAAGHDMKAVHAELRKLLADAPDAPRKLRALWALHVTGGDPPELLMAQLHNPSEYLRGWSIQFLMEDKRPPAGALAEFARMAETDASQFVRLYLASALQRLPAAQRWPIAMGLVSHAADADDHNLPLMYWYGIESAVPKNPALALRLAASSKIGVVRRYIARRLTGAGNTAVESVIALLGHSADPAVQSDLLGGIHEALSGHRHEAMPNGWKEVYARLANSPASDVRLQADKLALVYGDSAAARTLQQMMQNSTADAARRREALVALVDARPAGLAPLLQKLLDDAALRSDALRGLAAYADAHTPELILHSYAAWDAAQKRDAIDTLCARPEYALALLDAVEKKEIPASDISVFAARQLRQFRNSQINAKLTKVWGSINESTGDKQQKMARFKSILTPEFLKQADLARGRVMFSRTCAQCHTLYGVGGQVGPDLTGSNRHNLDYLLQKLTDPSAAVPNDYRMQIIVLEDGRLISGIVREQTLRSVTVQTDRQKLVIPRGDIAQMKPSKLSMMPEGQLDKMSREEMLDLIGYLQTRVQTPLPTEQSTVKQASLGEQKKP
jgi:putative membrane-bound dehydrogenase-like protein